MTPEQQRAAVGLLAEVGAMGAAETLGLPHVLVSWDPATEHLMVTGPFAGPAEASAEAERRARVENDPELPPMVYRVCALFPA